MLFKKNKELNLKLDKLIYKLERSNLEDLSNLVGSNVNLFFVAKFQEMIRKNLEEMGLPLEKLNSLKLRIVEVDNGLEM